MYISQIFLYLAVANKLVPLKNKFFKGTRLLQFALALKGSFGRCAVLQKFSKYTFSLDAINIAFSLPSKFYKF